MTRPFDSKANQPVPPPLALRVASILCWVVGILSIVGALTVSPSLGSAPDISWLVLAVNESAALAACAAGFLVWKGRRLGVLALGLAWALPSMANLLLGHAPRLPSLLMVLALVTLAANWELLK